MKMAEVQAKVSALDLNTVQSRLCKSMGLSQDQGKLAEERYRQFLALKLMYPGDTLVPPKLVDHFWHYHLVDTQKYNEDCQKLFGKPLPHTPDVSDAIQHTGWSRTKALYEEIFGIDVEEEGWSANTMGAAKCT